MFKKLALFLVTSFYSMNAYATEIRPFSKPQWDEDLFPENRHFFSPKYKPKHDYGKPMSQGDQFQFKLKKVIIRNAHSIDQEVFEAVFKDYIGKMVSTEDLHNLQQDLTRLYVSKGYINSGVVIPDQNISDGTLILVAVEGVIAEVNIRNEQGRIRQGYIDRLITEDDIKGVLNITSLQDTLRLVEQDRLIGTINANIRPTTTRGEAAVDIGVYEADPFKVSLVADNHISPSVGGFRQMISASHQNITGWGDAFLLSLERAEGFKGVNVFYDVPIGKTHLVLGYDWSQSKIVEEPFDILDIEYQSSNATIGLYRSFYKDLEHDWTGGVYLINRHNKSSLLGVPFSFSEGALSGNPGENIVTVLRINQQWQKRTTKRVLALYGDLDIGIDAFDASIGTEPDGSYGSIFVQGQWLEALPFLNSRLLSRAGIRLANQSVLPSERFSLGGANTIRGYRENAMARDNGWFASLEWKVPVGNYPIPFLPKSRDDGRLELGLFTDYGNGWNNDIPTPDDRQLFSVGVSINWAITNRIKLSVQAAHDLNKFNDDSGDIQDDGIHAALVIDLF